MTTSHANRLGHGQPSRRHSLLVVEDDPDIARLLHLHLTDLPGDVALCSDGAEALDLVTSARYDAIVLDLSLPRVDGLALCQAVRQSRVFTPILMLTARTSEMDRIVGLEVGADDYLTKPFSISELQARVKALVRRASTYAAGSVGDQPAVLTFGDLTIAADLRLVTLKATPIDLTAKEFDLLLWFARHPGRVYTREQLLDAVWGYSHNGYGHTVNSHINRLRAKIERDPASPEFVQTVWSIGYKFCSGGGDH